MWLIDWACEYCGYADQTVARSVDEILCPMCGEMVVPTSGDGRVRAVSVAEASELSRRQWPDPR